MTREPDELLGITSHITDELDVDWDRELVDHPGNEGVLRELQSLEKLARFQRERREREPEPDPGPALFHWGPLHVMEKLGEGSFSEVFRAWDPSLHREVALKLRHKGPEASAQRWLDEARRLARVRHPNVLHVYGIEVHAGRPGLWMELVHGETLEAWVARRGLLGAREAGDIGLALCHALVAVHAARLVHGDIKPSNVMREAGGRVVLTDFGAGSLLSPGATTTPVAFATPATAAPEVLLGGEARFVSDIYSLGALLYWLVTGRYPVAGSRLTEVRRGHEQQAAVALGDLSPDLPRRFVEVVDRALEPDPDRRLPTAEAMANALARAFALVGSQIGQADVASIAVLPLADLGGEITDDYFADGLADDLLNDLAHIPGLRVVGRTSSFRFRGQNEDLRRVGEELGVATVLEGSVRRSGSRVGITMRLVNAADGVLLWSDAYDREMADILAIQEEVARVVAEKLKLSLLRGGASRDTSPEAYDACLRGNHLLRQGSRENIERGLDYCRRAITLDPAYALAWARLALANIRRASFGLAPLEGYDQARGAARRSLELDPDLSLGHAALGLIALFHDWDWPAARREIERARLESPGDAGFTANAALVALAVGAPEKAMDLVRRATELDPLAARFWFNRASSALENGLLEEAGMAAERGLELDPKYPSAWSTLAKIHLAAGRLDTAAAVVVNETSEPWRLHTLAMVQHANGDAADSDATLATLIDRHQEDYACQIAESCAFRGEVDAAFAWLDRAYAQRDGGLIHLRHPPFTTRLSPDPRWAAFLERMRLPA